ncbi:MAG: HypC/HybG/HupF family hydrogenase formation chaperone [Phycisphaerales bacterium]|nr:MAG: HypC/HybG/HupF family hydrogenase formation chaperone [Phycisphaerales bacterium]
MCLGIPGQLTEKYEEHGLPMGKVDFGGVTKSVCLAHVPDLEVGEYAIVHVGFALSRLNEEEARMVFAFLDSMNGLEELQSGGRDVP